MLIDVKRSTSNLRGLINEFGVGVSELATLFEGIQAELAAAHVSSRGVLGRALRGLQEPTNELRRSTAALLAEAQEKIPPYFLSPKLHDIVRERPPMLNDSIPAYIRGLSQKVKSNLGLSRELNELAKIIEAYINKVFPLKRHHTTDKSNQWFSSVPFWQENLNDQESLRNHKITLERELFLRFLIYKYDQTSEQFRVPSSDIRETELVHN